MRSKRTRRAAGIAAVTVVIAATGVAGPAGALAAPARTGSVTVLGVSAQVTAVFEDGVEAKVAGGTVIPVAVTGGTVGATAAEFAAGKVTAKVGGIGARVTWVDETHVKVTAPATTKAGAVTMQLLVNGVAGPESTTKVVYRPTVSGLAPAKVGVAGGTVVTISGSGFLGVDTANTSAVKFGDTDAQAFTVLSATKITAVAPPGADGTAAVTVTTGATTNAASATATVTYRAALAIESAAEPTVKASGGPLVLEVTGGTLGANAKEFTANKISVLMGTKSLPATYVDATHLKTTVPAVSTDTVGLSVSRDGFVGESALVTVAPVVTSLSLKTDTVLGGGKVTVKIAGTDAAGATGFTFGDNDATCTKQGTGAGLSFLCTVPPADEAGPVWVSFVSGSEKASRFTSAAAFSYTAN